MPRCRRNTMHSCVTGRHSCCLGSEIVQRHDEELAKHPYQTHNLRHYNGDLTQIRSKDSQGWYGRR
jgi:hypothetical protein